MQLTLMTIIKVFDGMQGLALTDMKSLPPVIWHFPVLELPPDPAERFDQLFATREKWTRDELEPFIQ